MATITRRAMVGTMLTVPAALAARQAFARQNAVTHKVLLQAKGRVALVNEPDTVVPAFGEPSQRAELELRELRQQPQHERLVDHELGRPDRHRPTVCRA